LNPLKKLAGQTAIYGLSSVVPKFLSFLLVPIYTHYFKTSEYGVIADLYSLAVILNIIVTYGMETTFFWFTQSEKNSYNVYATSFFSILFTSLIFLGLVFCFSSNIAVALDYPDKQKYIIWLALIIAFDAISAIPFVKLRQMNKAFQFSIIKISGVFLNVLLNLIYLIFFPYLFKHGIISGNSFFYNSSIGIGYVLICNVVSSILVLIFLLRGFPFSFSFDFTLWKKMLKYTLPLLAAGLAGSLNDVIDRQFIKYFSPAGTDPMSQLGIYFANAKIAVILTVFIQTFRFAAEPFFFSYEKEKDSKEMFAQIMKYFVLISLVVYLFTLANLQIIKYYIGSAYWSGLHIVPIILASNVLVGIYLNQSIWYKLSGKTLFGLLIITIGALFTILLNYILVPKFGYTASAYIRFFCYVIMIIICYILGVKYYDIPYKLKDIFIYIFIAFFFTLIVLFTFDLYIVNQLIINNLICFMFLLFVYKRENELRKIFIKKKL
jgi:O-antigen/teichoic acid export membrane protein